jgi:molecular chaperone DnaJ
MAKIERDYYEVLGVERDADSDVIKKAYRRLAMQFHPDKNPGDKESEDKFKEAAIAYEVLSDTTKRERYDRFGHAGVNGPGGGQHFHDVGDVFAAFGDIFGDFFSGGGQRQRGGGNRPRRGADLRYLMEVELTDVLKGVDRPIQFECSESCEPCKGSGAEPGSKAETCPQCKGSGQMVRSQGFFQMATPCTKCRGTGQIIKNPCKTCKGAGRVEVERKLMVHVPAGVDNGTQLRLTGEGEGGEKNGPNGDLYVEIRVKAHDRFEREHENLFARLEITYLQALLGGKMEVETLTEKKILEIPRGSQYGDRLKLVGQGLPSLRGHRVGDLFYQLHVIFPKKLSKDEEKLLRQIAETKGESTSLGKSGFFQF